MKTVQELCTPRPDVLKKIHRDYALNLTDLIQDGIDADSFFTENYVTEGMQHLLRAAFDRFQGKTGISVIKLTQAMGGGKTHNMVALGLLAARPDIREKVVPEFASYREKVRVAAFSGRQSDVENGVWGSIAAQIGKEGDFAPYFKNGLKAPGETAWVNLLRGEPLLILLDEMPPYFENAQSLKVGDSNLAVVTTTALANLIVAANKAELGNVLVVISDLRATYEGGSASLGAALANLDNEVGRTALNLEPVRQNSDEVYHILKRKLFAALPAETQIDEIAEGYRKELEKAKQMDLTDARPEDFAARIRDSYPFHPAVRDLYARFKDNAGFQQTRGLLRLLRALVVSLYENSGRKQPTYLLAPADFNLNNAETHTQITQINSALTNAISHDIADGGNSEAERLDEGLEAPLHQMALTTILVSSLGQVQNTVRGLTEAELVHYLVSPGRDIGQIRQKVLPALRTSCWYLHADRDGRYVVKDVQNVVARINSFVRTYNQDQSVEEIRRRIGEIFEPATRDVYQSVAVLQPLDSIQLNVDKVVLLVQKPNPGVLDPAIASFYDEQVYKNRVLFLSGDRAGMDSLIKTAKELKAVAAVLNEMSADKIAESDPQFREAKELGDQYRNHFTSAARETFTRLYYPSQDKLMAADFSMNFVGNDYNGEQQIRSTLETKQKFTTDVDSDTFRKKCEQRLFGSQEMEWAEVRKRAAMQAVWQFHRPDALERLKDRMLRQDFWRENGRFVNKGPFPPPATGVQIALLDRDRETGAATLRVEPLHGDQVFFDVGAPPTEGSTRITDLKSFKTAAMRVGFLCVDSQNGHPVGDVVYWQNEITLAYNPLHQGGKTLVELKAVPDAPIRYTTDGSHPRDVGGTYSGPFEVKKKCLIQVIAEKDGIESDVLQVTIDPTSERRTIDPHRSLVLKARQEFGTTEGSFRFYEELIARQGRALGVRIVISAVGQDFVEYSSSNGVSLAGGDLKELVEVLRKPFFAEGQARVDTNVKTIVPRLEFPRGADFEDFVAKLSLSYRVEDVQQ
ncbi:MAG: DUF499 domain-containing protein [Leptospirales bacterium]|nr:DUF499 domain-containing protein [Leptospirales bacterium]